MKISSWFAGPTQLLACAGHYFVCGLWCVVLAAGMIAAGKTQAQSYPEKAIRFIVPYPPGGTTDLLARTLAQRLNAAWQQAVVVENRAGAGGAIGTEVVAKAPPDGYTIVLTSISHATAAGFFQKLPYNLLSDLQAVCLIATQPNTLVVHPSLPVRSLKDFIALSRARPGQLTFSSSGNGTVQHLMGELLMSLARIDMVHVPYKGTAPALTELISGQVSVGFQPVINAVPNAKAGRLRMLAVTGPKRSVAALDVPTVMEAGLPQYNVVAWYGVHAPVRAPKAVVDALNREMNRALAAPEISDRLSSQGLEPAGYTPEQFGAFVKSEVARWSKLIRESGIKPE